MDINLKVRKKQLEDLEHFINNTTDHLDAILHTIEWTHDSLKQETQLVKCPVNDQHLVHTKSIRNHVEKCNLKKEGYKEKDKFFSEPLLHPKASGYFNNAKKQEILKKAYNMSHNFKVGWDGQSPDPRTYDRFMSTYTTDERLALYNFAKDSTTGPPPLPEFSLLEVPSETSRELTYEERLIQERNAKRRRIKYRAVHTSRKNYTEIMREVIQGHMELYTDWIQEKHEISSHNSQRRKHLNGYLGDTYFSEDEREPIKNCGNSSAIIDYSRERKVDGGGSVTPEVLDEVFERDSHSRERTGLLYNGARSKDEIVNGDFDINTSRLNRAHSRCRSRDPSRARSRDPSRARSIDPSRARSIDPSRAKSRDPSRARSRDPSRARSREQSKSRLRAYSREKSAPRVRERSRSRPIEYREKSAIRMEGIPRDFIPKHRDRSHMFYKEHKSRARSRERTRSRSRGRSRFRDMDRSRGRSRSRRRHGRSRERGRSRGLRRSRPKDERYRRSRYYE